MRRPCAFRLRRLAQCLQRNLGLVLVGGILAVNFRAKWKVWECWGHVGTSRVQTEACHIVMAENKDYQPILNDRTWTAGNTLPWSKHGIWIIRLSHDCPTTIFQDYGFLCRGDCHCESRMSRHAGSMKIEREPVIFAKTHQNAKPPVTTHA